MLKVIVVFKLRIRLVNTEQFCEDMPNDQKATSNLLDTKTTT